MVRTVRIASGSNLHLPRTVIASLTCATALGCGGGHPVDAPVDGPPCAPFSVELPFRVQAAVSLGQDWGLVTNDLLATRQTPDLHASYARLDDTGTVVATAPLAGTTWGRRHQLAWNGTEIVYVSTSPTDVHLSFLAPDGRKTHDGPNLIEGVTLPPLAGSPASGIVRPTARGYAIVLDIPFTDAHPNAGFASTDLTGASSVAPFLRPDGVGSQVLALGALGDTVVVGWTPFEVHDFFQPFYAGPAFSTDRVAFKAPQPWTDSYDVGDGDSDGAIMMLVVPDRVAVRFDGTSTMSIPLDGPRAVAWTGSAFEVLTIHANQTGLAIGEVALTRDLEILHQAPIFPDSARGEYTTDAHDQDAFVSAGPGRVLFGFFNVVSGVGHQALAQVCL
jgi:hypothetical protein